MVSMLSPFFNVLKTRARRVVQRPTFILFLLPPDFFTGAMVEELEALRASCDPGTGLSWGGRHVLFFPGRPPPDREVDDALQEDDRALLACDIVDRHFDKLALTDEWDLVFDGVWAEMVDHILAARRAGRLSRRAIDRISATKFRFARPDHGIEFLARTHFKKVTGQGYLVGRIALIPLVTISTARGLAYMTFQGLGDGHQFFAYHAHLLDRLGERRLGDRTLSRDRLQEHMLLGLASHRGNLLHDDVEAKTSTLFVPGGALLGSRLHDTLRYFFTFVTDLQLSDRQRRLRDRAVPYRLDFWDDLPTTSEQRNRALRDAGSL